MDINAGAREVRGLNFLPVVYWYDKTHVASVAYYRDFVFGERYPEIDAAATKEGERLRMVRPTEVARDMRREMEANAKGGGSGSGAEPGNKSDEGSGNKDSNKERERESNEEMYTRLWQHRGNFIVQRGICFIEDALGKMLLHEIKVAVAEEEIAEMKRLETRVSRRQLDPSRWLRAHERFGTFVYVDDLGMGRGSGDTSASASASGGGGGGEGAEVDGLGGGGGGARGVGSSGSEGSGGRSARIKKGHDAQASSSEQGEKGGEGELVPHIRHSHGRKFLTVEKKAMLYGDKAKRGGGRDLSAWHGEIDVDLTSK